MRREAQERGGFLTVQAVAEESADGEGCPHLREVEPHANSHPGVVHCVTFVMCDAFLDRTGLDFTGIFALLIGVVRVQ